MESIYKEGTVFRSKKQKSFKVQCTGFEGRGTFEALKITGSGLPILDNYKNYNKDAFELEIQPTEKQKEIKQVLAKIANNILEISRTLEKMNDADIICSLGGNISLINLQLDKIRIK